MTKDDYPVIAYKIMSYYYACLREGTEGNVTKSQELTGCNDVYFRSVIDDLINNGFDYQSECHCSKTRQYLVCIV